MYHYLIGLLWCEALYCFVWLRRSLLHCISLECCMLTWTKYNEDNYKKDNDSLKSHCSNCKTIWPDLNMHYEFPHYNVPGAWRTHCSELGYIHRDHIADCYSVWKSKRMQIIFNIILYIFPHLPKYVLIMCIYNCVALCLADSVHLLHKLSS